MSKHSVNQAIATYRDELNTLEARIVALDPALAVFKSSEPVDALDASIEVTRPAVIVSNELVSLRTRANDLTAILALLSSHCSAK